METNKVLKGKGCPYEEGYEVVFNNFAIELNAFVFPSQWTGLIQIDNLKLLK